MILQEDNNGRKHITVPNQIAKALGWGKGKELSWKVKDNQTLILEEN